MPVSKMRLSKNTARKLTRIKISSFLRLRTNNSNNRFSKKQTILQLSSKVNDVTKNGFHGTFNNQFPGFHDQRLIIYVIAVILNFKPITKLIEGKITILLELGILISFNLFFIHQGYLEGKDITVSIYVKVIVETHV